MGTIYLSEQANPLLQSYLTDCGHKLKLITQSGAVYPEVASHADLYMCKLGASPAAPVFHIKELSELGFRYPENIKYNGVCMGSCFIHNSGYTSTLLAEIVRSLKLRIINVKQGYTKCNMVVISDYAAITSDRGIYNRINSFFKSSGCDYTAVKLLLVSEGHVLLPGFPCGFLGGASGRVGDEIIFNGNLETHPDFDAIKAFISTEGLTMRYFKEYPLTDIGSIIEEQ